MKKTLLKALCLTMLTPFVLGALTTSKVANAEPKEAQYKSIGYFYQENGDLLDIDVTKITHLNYSFGLIYHDEEGNQQNVPRDPSKLHTVYLPDKVKSDLALLPQLKEKNPNLKVLLSVGGWDCRGFSGAASTSETRATFVNSCYDIMNTYNLDGIDIDWEYPVNGGWGAIDSKPEDKQNYTLLLQDLRNKLGNDKLLTIAGAANKNFLSDWTEFDKILPLLDYINVMTYDYAYGSCYHNSALYASKEFPTVVKGDDYNADFIITNYINAGANPADLNMGVPFYARIPQLVHTPAMDWDIMQEVTTPYFTAEEIEAMGNPQGDYSRLVENFINKNGFTRKWDDDAKVPYLTVKDKDGVERFITSYDDEESLTYKTDYIKEKGLGGVMFWEFAGDYNNTLATRLAINLDINKVPVDPVTPPTDNKPSTDKKDENPKTGDFATDNNGTAISLVMMVMLASSCVVLKKVK